jgi:hypothetical protein
MVMIVAEKGCVFFELRAGSEERAAGFIAAKVCFVCKVRAEAEETVEHGTYNTT